MRNSLLGLLESGVIPVVIWEHNLFVMLDQNKIVRKIDFLARQQRQVSVKDWYYQ